MPSAPILELYVVWHPDDGIGSTVGGWLIDHFHGPAYAGLAGGAVEVYLRSLGWSGEGEEPRPLPFMEPLPAGLAQSQFTVVVPVMGRELARSVRDSEPWRAYIQSIFAADTEALTATPEKSVIVLPVAVRGVDLAGTKLSSIAGQIQATSQLASDSPDVLIRELAQAIAQRVSRLSDDPHTDERVTVFVSHTKHPGAPRDNAPFLLDVVRDVLQSTHLSSFFDAHDIQIGDRWEQVLDREAGQHALLMLRTDAYASREWTQREVLAAKNHDLPIVCIYAIREEERRGSFLMDHVPVVACPPGEERIAVQRALDRLVDETLKSALWDAQRVYLKQSGFDWLPVHAPEPVTLLNWIKSHPEVKRDPNFIIMHPDPPLGPKERQVILDVLDVAGSSGELDIFTPRTFATRGGRTGL